MTAPNSGDETDVLNKTEAFCHTLHKPIFIDNFTMMSMGNRKSLLPYIPGYDNNAVLKLIFFLAGSYMTLAICWAVMMIVNGSTDAFNTYLASNIALPSIASFADHWWTPLTYGFFHFPNSFLNMVSDMLWLYTFGSVTQMLIGKKQIIPLFLYGVIVGGLFYVLIQLIPGEVGKAPPQIMGPRAGLVAMCAAAVTLTPKYRFYLSETFSIPILVVAGAFGLLMIIGSGYYLSVIFMLLGGGLLGFLYVRLLKAGYRPGEWMYSAGSKLESMVTPDEQAISRKNSNKRSAVFNNSQPHAQDTESRVDAILDKINQKGYKSLTSEEKNFLTKAGK